MELRSDYWSGRIGRDPDTNTAFLAEIRAWLDFLGKKLVESGKAVSFEIRERYNASRVPSAGQMVLYLVSTREGIGATLVVIQLLPTNKRLPGRADGVTVHAQAREVINGHWRSDNVDSNPIYLMSLESTAVLSALQGILEGRIRSPERKKSA